MARRGKNWYFLHFFGKITPCGKIFKLVFQKGSSSHRSTCCVQISWNLVDGKSVKSCVIYLTKKTKFHLALQLSLLCDCAQNLPWPAHENVLRVLQISRFHPNWFTFGGVISKRMNIIRACSKVNPTLGWSLASSRIIMTDNMLHALSASRRTFQNLYLPISRRIWEEDTQWYATG